MDDDYFDFGTLMFCMLDLDEITQFVYNLGRQDMPIIRQRAFHVAPGTENQIPVTPTLYTTAPQVGIFCCCC
jgi:hypothetical protein